MKLHHTMLSSHVSAASYVREVCADEGVLRTPVLVAQVISPSTPHSAKFMKERVHISLAATELMGWQRVRAYLVTRDYAFNTDVVGAMLVWVREKVTFCLTSAMRELNPPIGWGRGVGPRTSACLYASNGVLMDAILGAGHTSTSRAAGDPRLPCRGCARHLHSGVTCRCRARSRGASRPTTHSPAWGSLAFGVRPV